MKSYRKFLFIAAFVLIVCGVKVYANSLQLNTYYPAPSGYYDSVQVKNGLQLPCHKNDISTSYSQVPLSGSIWYKDNNCSQN